MQPAGRMLLPLCLAFPHAFLSPVALPSCSLSSSHLGLARAQAQSERWYRRLLQLLLHQEL